MIPKPEFGDYHKFRVSLAVAMIAAGPTMVWFFLRQPFDLLRSKSELESLTPFARTVIELRQYVSTSATLLVIISGILLIALGVRWLRAGLKDWKGIQDIHDEILLLDRDLKKADLRPLTSEEIVEGDREEIAAATESPDETVEDSPTQSTEVETPEPAYKQHLLKYRELQSMFARKLKDSAGERYLILTDQSLRRLRYDFLLRSHSPELPDVLIEFKAVSSRTMSRTLTHRVEATIYQYAVSTSVYADSVGRKAKLLIIFAVTGDELQSFEPARITARVNEMIEDIQALDLSVTVLLTTESAIRSLDRDELGQLLRSSESEVIFKL